jgi:4-amino-4-deoxy-L-arabinose transferase-like glycosyltransferase
MMKNLSQTERLTLLALLLASIILSVAFALRLPLDANPDERAHRDYVRLLIETGSFIVFRGGDPAYFETHQPPLYYLLCAPVFRATGGDIFALRMVAALIQLITIMVVFRAAKDLFPSRPEIAIGAAGFVTFLPTQAQLAGSINNDPLITLWCAFLFWKLGRVALKGGKNGIETAGMIALFLGVGLLTKLSMLQLVPTIILAYFIAYRTQKITFAQGTLFCTVAIVGGFLLASPWLIRNTLLYGDPFTLKIFPLTAGEHTPTPDFMMTQMRWSFGEYVIFNAVRTFASFWFIVAPNAVLPPVPPFLIVAVLAVVGIVGAFRSSSRGGVPDSERRVLFLFFLGLLILIPFFVRFNLRFYQAQGRYFLPALLPVTALCLTGWSNVVGKNRSIYAIAGVVIVLILLCLLQLSYY